jgi:hypothetical protein
LEFVLLQRFDPVRKQEGEQIDGYKVWKGWNLHGAVSLRSRDASDGGSGERRRMNLGGHHPEDKGLSVGNHGLIRTYGCFAVWSSIH